MRRFITLLLLLFCSACPSPEGGPDPGDQGAIGWKPPVKITGPVIDCQGQTRDRLTIKQSGTTVRNCIINGDVRIQGLERNANRDVYKDRSDEADYVKWVRSTSPSWVTIQDTKIIGTHTIPLFISVGVTMTTISRVEISGTSDATMVYLEAESHGTTMEDVTIDATQSIREGIAIDASDGNVFSGIKIEHSGNGGVYMYRNCGEYGTSRHTTPSDNVIEGTITGGEISVWMGSREGNRLYCRADENNNYGSGVSDFDHSRRNTINVTADGEIKQGMTASGNVIH